LLSLLHFFLILILPLGPILVLLLLFLLFLLALLGLLLFRSPAHLLLIVRLILWTTLLLTHCNTAPFKKVSGGLARNFPSQVSFMV